MFFRCLATTALLVLGLNVSASPNILQLDAETIRSQGLHARLNPTERDGTIQELAGWITEMKAANPDRVEELQGDIQFALMLMVDLGVYETLSSATIDAVDDALESVFDLDEIGRSTRWEPLIYVYGFFNRDVTPGQIAAVRAEVAALTQIERNRIYHVFPHTVDAVCKPISMGGLATPEDTQEALRIAVPMLKAALMQDSLPGRAFHPPSHAALVLGPLFERWPADTPEGTIIREHIASRDEVVRLLMRQLSSVATDGRAMKKYEKVYYGRTGQYAANALARLDAREAVPALQADLAGYGPLPGSEGSAARYLRRALAALGDKDARADLEKQIETNPDLVRDTAVWLCRNGRGEGVEYGAELLGKVLDCSAKDALERYFASL